MTRQHVVLSLFGALIAALVFVASRLTTPTGTLIDIILVLALVGTGALLVLVVMP
jgi:hypothetical protein